MTARGDLFDYLETAYSGDPVKVVPAPDGTDPEPAFDLILVGQDAVEPGTFGNSRARTLQVLYVCRLTTPGTSDDDLEAALEGLLDVLDGYGFAQWSKAERGTYRESYPCYTVTLTATA